MSKKPREISLEIFLRGFCLHQSQAPLEPSPIFRPSRTPTLIVAWPGALLQAGVANFVSCLVFFSTVMIDQGFQRNVFLEALKYLKTSKKHSFETPGMYIFVQLRSIKKLTISLYDRGFLRDVLSFPDLSKPCRKRGSSSLLWRTSPGYGPIVPGIPSLPLARWGRDLLGCFRMVLPFW